MSVDFRRFWLLYVAGVVLTAGLIVVVTDRPLLVVAVPLALFVVVVVAQRPELAASIFGAASLVIMRPGVLGEQYSKIADGLAIVAGLAAFLADGQVRGRRRYDDSVRTLAWLQTSTIVFWVWIGVTVALGNTTPSNFYRGIVDIPVVVVMLAKVAKDPARRQLMVKIFIAVLAIETGSYVITLLRILAFGPNAGFVGYLPIGYTSNFDFPPGYLNFAGTQTVELFQPGTLTTVSVQQFLGTSVTRFLAIGREPGIGAVYLLWSLWMMKRVGWNSRWLRGLLAFGLIGTLSTAGFGVLVVVVVVSRIIAHSGRASSLTMLRQLTGLVVLVGGCYLAYYAPSVGVADKQAYSAVSVNDRTSATLAGLKTIATHPLGRSGLAGVANVGENVIASASTLGVLGVILVLLIFVGTWRASPSPIVAFGSMAVIMMTVLLSQPFTDSAAFYVLLGLGCCSYKASSGADSSQSDTDELEATRLVLRRR